VSAALALFAAFCLVSSAAYALNDVMDREADRAHPDKRARPVASGRIGVRPALLCAAAFALAGLGIAAWVSTTALAIAGAYIVLNLAYSMGLKHVALLDVFLIAAGFMLRILAGTSGIGIAPSRWLLLCGLMVTLFLGFAKRRAELAAVRERDPPLNASTAPHAPGARSPSPNPSSEPVAQRRALDAYSLDLLDRMIAVSAAGAFIAYALYTVDERTVAVQGTDKLVLTVPLVLYGLYRYMWVLYRRGGGADPSAELLRDPHLLGALVGWLCLTWWLIA
jgi:hypothetical protein